MMRARRHRPRARDRPRRAPAIDRYDADSLLESESEPPTRARTRRPLARRADESPHTHTHTHTHTTDARPPRSRPNDPRLATRASTSPVPSRVTHPPRHSSRLPASTHGSRVDFSTTTALIFHPPITHITQTRPPPRGPTRDTSTDHDSSSVIHTATPSRAPSFSTVENPKNPSDVRVRSTTARARAFIVHRVFVSRVSRARVGKKAKRDASEMACRECARARTRDRAARARQ